MSLSSVVQHGVHCFSQFCQVLNEGVVLIVHLRVIEVEIGDCRVDLSIEFISDSKSFFQFLIDEVMVIMVRFPNDK